MPEQPEEQPQPSVEAERAEFIEWLTESLNGLPAEAHEQDTIKALALALGFLTDAVSELEHQDTVLNAHAQTLHQLVDDDVKTRRKWFTIGWKAGRTQGEYHLDNPEDSPRYPKEIE